MNSKKLNSLKRIALSQNDILKLCDTRVLAYPELTQARSIDELLEPHGSFVVLILLTSDSEGHWVCCVRQDPQTIMYFDSYGIKPDNEFKWISEAKREELQEAGNSMRRLLTQAQRDGQTVCYNQYALQGKSHTVSTCGRWCVVRIWCPQLTAKQFAEEFDDNNVTYYTDYVIRQRGGYDVFKK